MNNRLRAEFNAINMKGLGTEEDKLLADTVGFKTIKGFRDNLEDLIEKAETLSRAFSLLDMDAQAVKWAIVELCLKEALGWLDGESGDEGGK